jgi:hypothetical protein
MRHAKQTPSRHIAQRVTAAREHCIRRYMAPRVPRSV